MFVFIYIVFYSYYLAMILFFNKLKNLDFE